MPQFRPRPSVGGFRQAPVADIGRAISGVGSVLGGIAEGQTRAELQDIKFQEEMDRVQQIQVENLDKSEVLKQKNIKRGERNREILRLTEEARTTGNYDNLPDNLEEWEQAYDTDLMQDSSPGFQNLWPSQDSPIRAGKQNEMFTTQAAGRFQVMQNDYDVSLSALSDSITPDMTSAQVVELFNDSALDATSVGLNNEYAQGRAEEFRDEALSNWVLNQPITSGLAALTSDPNVRGALDKSQRDTLRRSITAQKNAYLDAREAYGEAFLVSTGVNIDDNFLRGDTELEQIASLPEDMPEGTRKEALDFIGVLHRNKTQGAQFSADEMNTNAKITKRSLKLLNDELNGLKDLGLDDEEIAAKKRELAQKAAEIMNKATLQNSEGSMRGNDLADSRFDAIPLLSSAMRLSQDVDVPSGFFKKTFDDSLNFFSFGLISTSVGNSVKSTDTTPSVLISQYRSNMVFGSDAASNFPPEAEAFMDSRLVKITLDREDEMSQTMTEEEAGKLRNEIVQQAQQEYVQATHPELQGDAIQNRVDKIFHAKTEPTVKVAETPNLVRGIQGMLDDGSTVSEIRAEAERHPDFNEAAFSNALAQVSAPDITLPEVDNQRSFAITTGTTSDSGIEFIKSQEGFFRNAEFILDEDRLTGGFGSQRDDLVEGEEITDERADEFLREDVLEAETAVKEFVPNWQKLSENEFDAVVSLTFNAGQGAVGKSEAIKALNAALSGGDRDAESINKFLLEAFDSEQGFVRADGEIIQGLVNRRSAERALFEGG